jgi:hypothetical protein
MRKNEFEKHLTNFYPYRQLPQKREAYMQKVSKYNHIMFALFLLPFFILVYVLFKENYQEISEANTPFSEENLMLMLAIFLPPFVCYYIIFYIQQRSKKAKRMLLEKMSDTDFELLLKLRDNLSFPYKYDPPFVLCNNHLYIFLFHTIKEIDPTQITSVKWYSNRHRFIVRIKDSKAKVTVLSISKSALDIFLQIVEQYTKLNLLTDQKNK